MNKKTIIVMIIILNLSLFLGCSLKNDESVSGYVKKDPEVMGALNETIISIKSKSTNTIPNDDLVEMRHWQYGAKGPDMTESGKEAVAVPADNYPTAGYDYETSSDSRNNNESHVYTANTANTYGEEVISIQLLTEEEMDAIVGKLIDLGYLESTSITEEEFHEDLRSFQRDQGLKITGTLDPDTLSLLKT